MNCNDVREQLSAYLDNQSGDQAHSIRDHLTHCAGCQTEFDRLSAAWTSLDVLSSLPLPSGYEARFWARLRREHVRGNWVDRWFGRHHWAGTSLGVAGALAMWLIGVTIGWRAFGRAGYGSSPGLSPADLLSSPVPPGSLEQIYLDGLKRISTGGETNHG